MREILAWVILICLFLVSCTYATTAPPVPVSKFDYIADQSSTTLSFDPANDLIVVNATINGKGPFRFLLDTGASHNVMAPELAQSLGLKVERGGTVDAGGQAKVSAGLVQGAEVQLGGFTLAGQSFFVTPFPSAYPFQGFLGAEVFRRFIVHIDFRGSLLTLTVPGGFRYQGAGVVLPIKFHEGLIPQVKAEVDGYSGWFKLDTGYNGSLALFRKFIDEHELLTKYGPKQSGTGARTLSGEVNNIPAALIREFKLGELKLGGILTSFFLEKEGSNAIFAGAVGVGVLKQFDVIIDYQRKRVIFENKSVRPAPRFMIS